MWCLFEVYVAIQRDIEITLVFPGFDSFEYDMLDQFNSLQDIFDFCSVDSAKAVAGVASDANLIKDKIIQEVGTFQHLDETVEELLVSEMLQMWNEKNEFQRQEKEIEAYRKETDSRYFGVSLDFALSELKCLYRNRAPEAEWRLHDNCEVTESGFIVKVRDCCDVERGVVTWGDLDVCSPPENPNFYQLAGLLAYGPHAVGKGQICPRDRRPDCSLVDALWKENKSGQANWFLSWAWSYTLDVVSNALARWWDSHAAVVASEACQTGSVYLWCASDSYVNNDSVATCILNSNGDGYDYDNSNINNDSVCPYFSESTEYPTVTTPEQCKQYFTQFIALGQAVNVTLYGETYVTGIGHGVINGVRGNCWIMSYEGRKAVIFQVDIRSWSLEITYDTLMYLTNNQDPGGEGILQTLEETVLFPMSKSSTAPIFRAWGRTAPAVCFELRANSDVFRFVLKGGATEPGGH
eukprot:s97_g30.t1